MGNNIFYIVNSRLTYVSTKLMMEWCGIKGKKSLFTYYQSLQADMDYFLMENCNKKTDTIILVGFTKEINMKMRDLFKGYKIIGIPSDISDSISPFEYALKTYSKGKKMTAPQVEYVKYMLEAIHNNFKSKNPYLMNIVFNSVSANKFDKHFANGWNDLQPFANHIKKHLDAFKKQNQDVFELNGYYFVNAPIQFYTDYVFKYHKLYTNLNLIDDDAMKVYFKRMYGSKDDIRKFCEMYCDNVLGGNGFCSGKITKKFLAATKGMTNQSEALV